MKKILLLPLLDSLNSGHHHVANTITQYVNNRSNDIECISIDLVNRWNPVLESIITKTYLWWVQKFPKIYSWTYRKFAYESKKSRSYKYYEIIFLNVIKKIIATEKPDLIICTHGFPSYLVNTLKKSGVCSVPLLNIYTDFFINDLWGREMVDYYFVSDIRMKTNLLNVYSISDKSIFLTGIPVDESFNNSSDTKKTDGNLNIILTGGSAGLGKIKELIKSSKLHPRINLFVMTGNNKKLYNDISKLSDSNIYPLPYISSREQLNDLYNIADAIITKPGGVTISEAIKKRIPIFIHSTLPGQEEINLKHLKEQGLVFTLEEGIDIAEQVIAVLSDNLKMLESQRSLQRYINNLDLNNPENIFSFIESIIYPDKKEFSLNAM